MPAKALGSRISAVRKMMEQQQSHRCERKD
jgi:hypothetical protein